MFRRSVRAFLLGLPGVLLLPFLVERPAFLPEEIPTIALAVNPLILLVFASVVGALCAVQSGLRSDIVAGSGFGRHTWFKFLGWGTVIGYGVAILDHSVRGLWQVSSAVPSLIEGSSLPSFALGLTYGGITEEIMLR